MTLSDEWINFLISLNLNGPQEMKTFASSFNNQKKAERMLGEIIRQGLIDLDDELVRIEITEKGRALVQELS